MITKPVSIVVAIENSNGIGQNGNLPWPHLSKDLKFFRELTSACPLPDKRNAIVMGHNTWKSIPLNRRPLANRLNIVLSRSTSQCEQLGAHEHVQWLSNLEDALLRMEKDETVHSIFIIGGGEIYRQALELNCCQTLYVTRIYGDFDCDTFFPPISMEQFKEDAMLIEDHAMQTEKDVKFQFKAYTRIHEEVQYLNMIRQVIQFGNDKGDRTGVGTVSTFGQRMRFNLRNGTFPLLTTKRVFWRGVAEELLWFVAGSTNGQLLREKNIHIWDGNGSRQYLDSIGLTHREEMDLGPVYGFQWRHWGAEYSDMHADYKGKGIDQLADCIDKIKNKPNDRRIVMSAWNPSDMSQMALPPCHMFCQFYVANGELSCLMYQRSCDMGLG